VEIFNNYAYIGCDGNPYYGGSSLSQFDMNKLSVVKTVAYPSSCLRMTGKGNLIAATSRHMSYGAPYFYKGVVFTLPGLNQTGQEFRLPSDVIAISAVGL